MSSSRIRAGAANASMINGPAPGRRPLRGSNGDPEPRTATPLRARVRLCPAVDVDTCPHLLGCARYSAAPTTVCRSGVGLVLVVLGSTSGLHVGLDLVLELRQGRRRVG